MLWCTENGKPTLEDLSKYVISRYATDWYDIGIKLGLYHNVLEDIKNDIRLQNVGRLSTTLGKWINTDNATWRTLEIVLTNINRGKLGLNMVDGKEHIM